MLAYGWGSIEVSGASSNIGLSMRVVGHCGSAEYRLAISGVSSWKRTKMVRVKRSSIDHGSHLDPAVGAKNPDREMQALAPQVETIHCEIGHYF